MRRLWSCLLIVFLLSQPACISKLWKKDKDPTAKLYDVYGTVEEITPDKVVIQTKSGSLTFVITQASIKGSSFGQGALVHVYYKKLEEGDVVTMVVEKIG